MKLQDAIKTDRFRNARHMAALNVLYTAYWFKTHNNSALKEVGLTSEQFNVMRILKGKHPQAMCVRDIGSRMLENNSNVPRILDRLVAKKLAKRTPSKEDKRETLVNLSNEGLTLLDEANKISERLAEKLIGLNEKEASQLNELLEKLRLID